MTEGIWIALIGGVIGPLVVLTLKKWLDDRKAVKPSDMVTEALEVGELITNRLESIKEVFDADRVWISQFHN